MRLQSLEVDRYRKLRDATIQFRTAQEDSSLGHVYGSVGLSVFAGPNGSGKTSVLSLVARIFHNIERFPERLPDQFSLKYSIPRLNGQGNHGCRIYKQGTGCPVQIAVDESIDAPILPWNNRRPRRAKNPLGVEFASIESYLPQNVILSTFSLHGEYPSRRPPNYQGDARVISYDTSNLYGRNHFNFPSFSTAIGRLMERAIAESPATKALEAIIGGRFTGRVQVRDVYRYGMPGDSAHWVDFTPELLNSALQADLYLNDFEIQTAGGRLTLGTMSSGQKMLMVRLLSLLGKAGDRTVALIEEPEIHLDPSWSRQIVSVLLLFFRETNMHILLSTHSFSLINAVPSECVSIVRDGTVVPPSENTFLANESAVAGAIFQPARHIVEDEVLRYAEGATIEQLRQLMAKLGQSSVKFDVFRLLEAKARQQ